MSIGHSPHVESYKPDMKKDERDITAEDRQDAKRRIEGSLASNTDTGGFIGESATVGDGVVTLDQAHIQ